jgi:hypothetical protein
MNMLDTVVSAQMNLDFFLCMFMIKHNQYTVKYKHIDDNFRPPIFLSQSYNSHDTKLTYMEIGVRPTLAYFGAKIKCSIPSSVWSRRTYAIFCTMDELQNLFSKETAGFVRYSKDRESVVFKLNGQRDRYYPAKNVEAALDCVEQQWRTGGLVHKNRFFLIQKNIYAENISSITTDMIEDGL